MAPEFLSRRSGNKTVSYDHSFLCKNGVDRLLGKGLQKRLSCSQEIATWWHTSICHWTKGGGIIMQAVEESLCEKKQK
jgi:hypothetical protein